jgi:hypothetical protein
MAFRKEVPTVRDVEIVCDEHPDIHFYFSNGRLNVSKGGVNE